ncbi:hypothetical protein BSKO_05055 [Bryopsis sp. KO-2023]|nr:hypothetical protein BSKO_05055 [Bryopsis sp. KO-2023]
MPALGMVLALLLVGAVGAQDCGGHGSLIEDGQKCNCTNPFPSVGVAGWTGEDCEYRVYGANLDGEDMTLGCRDQNCSFIDRDADATVCFAVPILWRDFNEPWNYLAVQLSRTSEEGDPDLYGLFVGGPNDEGKVPGRSQGNYDFIEISSAIQKTVVKVLKKRDFGVDKDYTGAYLCVTAYGTGSTEFTIRGKATQCAASFQEDGSAVMCSTPLGVSEPERRYSECKLDGTCVCRAPYAPPDELTVEGVGFEDCSAQLTAVKNEDFYNGFYVDTHNRLDGGLWHFYSFNVTRDDFHVVVKAMPELDNTGELQLFAKLGGPPTKHFIGYDLRSSRRLRDEENPTVELKYGDEFYREGLWFIGVYSDGKNFSEHSLTISKFECFSGCNGNGYCEKGADGFNTCKCNRGYFMDDCSGTSKKLAFNEPYEQSEKRLEYEYFQLPKISTMSTGHNVEMSVEAQFFSESYPSFISISPRLLLLKGGAQDFPTINNYTYAVELREQRKPFHVPLCPSILDGDSIWRAAIYNPIENYEVGYKINLQRKVSCLNDCSGNGVCNENGICQCKLPDRRLRDHKICWRSCVCEPGKKCVYGNKCDRVTCDDGWRLTENKQSCVQDECIDSIMHTTEDSVCLRKCIRPSNGPATLSEECDPDTFHCLRGTKMISSRGSQYCASGCEEGSLKPIDMEVDNARAFVPCTCKDDRQGNKVCKHEIDGAPIVLHCAKGHTLKGGERISGSDFTMGGQCVKASKAGAMSRWGVVFLVVVISVLGVALGVFMFKSRAGASFTERIQNMYYEKMRGRSNSFEPNEL